MCKTFDTWYQFKTSLSNSLLFNFSKYFYVIEPQGRPQSRLVVISIFTQVVRPSVRSKLSKLNENHCRLGLWAWCHLDNIILNTFSRLRRSWTCEFCHKWSGQHSWIFIWSHKWKVEPGSNSNRWNALATVRQNKPWKLQVMKSCNYLSLHQKCRIYWLKNIICVLVICYAGIFKVNWIFFGLL